MKTILVVDDEPIIRHLVKALLSQRGFRVLEAPDGVAALKRCADETIDVALIDYIMPGMDGAQVYHRLSGLCPAARLIMMSGYPEHIAQGKVSTAMAGDTVFLPKPFRKSELLAAIEGLG